jgi:hypothetical protein
VSGLDGPGNREHPAQERRPRQLATRFRSVPAGGPEDTGVAPTRWPRHAHWRAAPGLAMLGEADGGDARPPG